MGEQAIQPDSFSQNHIRVSRSHFQSRWMVSNQDVLSSRLPRVGRTNFLIKDPLYPRPHPTGIFPETKSELRSLANRGSGQLLELAASILWPLQKLLSGDGMLSWRDLPEPPYDTGRAICSRCAAGPLAGGEARQLSPQRRWRTGEEGPATDCFLLTLSKLQVIPLPPPSPHPQKGSPGMKGDRRKPGPD